jgi:hypothetical protein
LSWVMARIVGRLRPNLKHLPRTPGQVPDLIGKPLTDFIRTVAAIKWHLNRTRQRKLRFRIRLAC